MQNVSDLKFPQLKDLAKKLGITVPFGIKKEALIDLINAKQSVAPPVSTSQQAAAPSAGFGQHHDESENRKLNRQKESGYYGD